ncbi:hypothetical protein DMUE_0760 [Dictyocoela muelleri]|nr:hypothetical protein DMUE_0760 [Dictyocoela muelleri]
MLSIFIFIQNSSARWRFGNSIPNSNKVKKQDKNSDKNRQIGRGNEQYVLNRNKEISILPNSKSKKNMRWYNKNKNVAEDDKITKEDEIDGLTIEKYKSISTNLKNNTNLKNSINLKKGINLKNSDKNSYNVNDKKRIKNDEIDRKNFSSFEKTYPNDKKLKFKYLNIFSILFIVFIIILVGIMIYFFISFFYYPTKLDEFDELRKYKIPDIDKQILDIDYYNKKMI